MKEVLTNIDWKTINEYVDKDLLITNKHPELDLWILNYSKTCQFEKAWDLVTLSCRGLVVDIDGNIIARPFTKFFNKEELETEGYMDTTNIGTIPNLPFETFEKMDGSLGILFNYKGEWIFSSRGSFESDQAIKGKEMFNEDSLIDPYIPENLLFDYTYLFEIIYPENRIVLDYGKDEKLTLLGVINRNDGEEMSYDNFSERYHKSFHLVRKIDGVKNIDALKSMEVDNEEGFVVRFSNGFRMKVKFDEYCRLHRIVTNVSNKTIWESLRNDEGLDEVLDRVPDEFYNWVRRTELGLKDSFKEIEFDALNKFKWTIAELVAKEVEINKKEFALLVKDHKYSGLLFSMWNGKTYSEKIWKMIKPEWSTPFRDGYEDEEL